MSKKIGLKYPVCAKYSDITGTPVYTNGMVMAKAIEVKISWDKNDEELCADDALDECDNSIIGGKEILSINELPDKVQAFLFGHETTKDGEIVIAETDISPYVGHGFYGKVKIGGAVKWRTVWISKMIFGVPDDETKTKGKKIEYLTPTVEGKITKDIRNKFVYKKLHDTEASAIAYLNAKAGIVPQLNKPEASLKNGTYTGIQSVSLAALEGATIYFTTNGTTPSETNGTEYTAPIEISSSCALRAIAVKDDMSNSEIASYEYIITV